MCSLYYLLSILKILFFLWQTDEGRHNAVDSKTRPGDLVVPDPYGTFRDDFGRFWMLSDILESFGTFWDVLGHFGMF